jgi:hypothetical protein
MLRKLLIVALFVSLLIVAVAATTAVDTPVCDGSPPTQLVGVNTGRVARTFSTLRNGVASFNVLQILPHGAEVTILDGPVCDTVAGHLSWWQVSYGDLTGWVSEGQVHSIWGNNLYWIEPVSDGESTPEPTAEPTCDASPPPRLEGETQGEVAQSFSTMWTGIGSFKVIRIMPGGAQFDILDGPVCAGPHYWYQVSYKGDTGWATEGYQDEYWLEPVTTD